MTKTDFAELKEKLTKFNRKQINLYLKKCLDCRSGFSFEQEAMILLGAEMKFKESAAIISELIEIIQSQSEALELYEELVWNIHPKEESERYAAKSCLSETTKRLQKLMEGK